MTFLSDGELRRALSTNHLSVEPLTDAQIGPASIDLRLGTSFGEYRAPHGTELDTKLPLEDYLTGFSVEDSGRLVLRPGDFLLAHTVEVLTLPADLIGFVWGRSSLGRLAIQVHDAGFVDPGFHGSLTLEIANHQRLPVALYASMKVCQIAFAWVGEAAEKPYSGKYAGDRGFAGSRLHRDWER